MNLHYRHASQSPPCALNSAAFSAHALDRIAEITLHHPQSIIVFIGRNPLLDSGTLEAVPTSTCRIPSRISLLFNVISSISSLSLLAEGARKVNLLLAVLEVDGPDTIKIKNGRDAEKA
jgi:hypothetical protein